MCGSPHNVIMRWVNNNPKRTNKMECPLRNNGKTLQGRCVTVTQMRATELLLKVQLQAMKIPLSETRVTLTHKKVKKVQLERESKCVIT